MGVSELERETVGRVCGGETGGVLAAGGGAVGVAMCEALFEVRGKRGDAGDVLDGCGELSLHDELDDLEAFAVARSEVPTESTAPSTGLDVDVPADPLNGIR